MSNSRVHNMENFSIIPWMQGLGNCPRIYQLASVSADNGSWIVLCSAVWIVRCCLHTCREPINKCMLYTNSKRLVMDHFKSLHHKQKTNYFFVYIFSCFWCPTRCPSGPPVKMFLNYYQKLLLLLICLTCVNRLLQVKSAPRCLHSCLMK